MNITVYAPEAMKPSDRKTEIAALLAIAFVRLLARRNGLAMTSRGEPSCTTVDGRERRGRLAPTTRREVR